MRPFNLYRRSGSPFFYVRFKDEKTGKWLSGISTGETTEHEAMAQVARWEADGITTRDRRTVQSVVDTRRLIDSLKTADLSESDGRAIIAILEARGIAQADSEYGRQSLKDFLTTFWSWEQSPYVAEKLAHKHRITKKHVYSMSRHVRNHWAPYFGDKRLCDVTRADVKTFSLSLSSKLSGGSINHVLYAGKTAFRWARDNGYIPADPTERIPMFDGTGRTREILTPDEIRQLFNVTWPSDAARTASLTAMTTGLRAGEIAALQIDDIGADRLYVRHNWSEHDRLKRPKNNEEHITPLLPGIRERLVKLAEQNPHGGPFVFWTVSGPDRPQAARTFQQGLIDALILIDLPSSDLDAEQRVINARHKKHDPEPVDLPAYERVQARRRYWRDRGVSFHAWRHHFAARLADRTDMRLVQRGTGHKSAAMAEFYAAHRSEETFQELAAAVGETFKILPFPGTNTTEAQS